MENDSKRIRILFAISILISILGNTIAYNKFGIIIIAIVLTLFILLFFCRKAELAFFLILLFTFNMDDISKEIANINYYSLKTVTIAGISVSTICILIFFITQILFYKNKLKILKSKQVLIILTLFFISFFNGILNLIFGTGSEEAFFQDIQIIIIYIVSILIGIMIKNKKLLIELLFVAIVSKPVGICFSILMGLDSSTYSGLKLYSYDSFNLFIIMNLLNIFFINRFRNKYIIFITSIASAFVILHQVSGKDFVVLILSIILFVFSFEKTNNYIRKILITITTLTGTTIIAKLLVDYANSGKNLLFTIKYQQFKSLFDFIILGGKKEYVYNIPESPRIRVMEFYNTFYTLAQNIFFVLFGKGIGGAFNDKYLNITYVEGAYSNYAWSTRKFGIVHESINFTFLKFGLAGILYLINVIMFIIKSNIEKLKNSYEFNFLKIATVIAIIFLFGTSVKIALFIGMVIGIIIGYKLEAEDEVVK